MIVHQYVCKMKHAKQVNFKKSIITILVLAVAAVLIKVVSFYPAWIEKYYSTGIYVYISIFLRAITGWVPFSIGDILYALITFFFIIKLVQLVWAIIKRTVTTQSFLNGIISVIRFFLWLYIIFNIFWGLNYNRLGIAYQLGIQQEKYSTQELKTLTNALIQKLNNARKSLGDSTFQYPPTNKIFEETVTAYDSMELKFSFLHYRQPCIKSSLFGKPNDYLGFQGYYNPFTGESQVNTTVPPFIIPYTACHEVAHQIGYGDEDEANFVGYLTAKASPNNIFHYSVYFDLFNYANSELFLRDSAAARANFHLLDTLVKHDERVYRNFLIAYRNQVDYYVTILYGNYLKANNQPNGMDTYSEVTSWLIAYQKKYGEL